jgi:Ala-tRNA(Pro) deacylase
VLHCGLLTKLVAIVFRNSFKQWVYFGSVEMNVISYLEALGIDYYKYEHPAVYTCEEADSELEEMYGQKTKSLFVRDRKGRKHFLVVVGYYHQVDLKALGRMLGVPQLGLASPDRLKQYLGVEPGSVSMLALINDKSGSVQPVLDRSIWQSEQVLCHPLVNTQTLRIARLDLEKFLEKTGHTPLIIDVPHREV